MRIILCLLMTVLLLGCGAAYRGVSQGALVSVRSVSIYGAEANTNEVSCACGRLVIISENVYLSSGGGASNNVAPELTVPLVK
jgi:hypothetical protein